jgi:hypothetical protein
LARGSSLFGRALSRSCAGALVVSLVGAPIPSFAAAPPDESGEEAPEDDEVMAEAKQLFDAGVARYTAADYGAAVDLWLEAYAMVPPTFENRLIKAELIYNVARAQQKWFEIDQDIKHLRQSRATLERYLGEVDEIYGEQAGLEREKIEEQIADIEAQISEWEAEQARREAELAERMRPKFDEEADAREERRNKAMIGAGAGLTALGAGGVGLLVTGVILAGSAENTSAQLPLADDIPARQSAISRGQAGNALMVVGTLSAGVFLAAGVPLLAVGVVSENKRKRRRADAGLDVARVDVVAPMWLRGGAGLSLGGRF